MADKNDEMILVAPRAACFGADDAGAFNGVRTDLHSLKRFEAAANMGLHMRRGDAEKDERFKQLVPYAVVLRASGSARPEYSRTDARPAPAGMPPAGADIEVFVYERLKGATENRLHGKLSIGVGGHINPEDLGADGTAAVEAGAKRELDEELEFDLPAGQTPTLMTVGIINDDRDHGDKGVGRVHLGVLMTCLLPFGSDARVNPNETDQLRGGWINVDELLADAERVGRLEPWSKLALAALAWLLWKTKGTIVPEIAQNIPAED